MRRMKSSIIPGLKIPYHTHRPIVRFQKLTEVQLRSIHTNLMIFCNFLGFCGLLDRSGQIGKNFGCHFKNPDKIDPNRQNLSGQDQPSPEQTFVCIIRGPGIGAAIGYHRASLLLTYYSRICWACTRG